jgi:hypothetical protein
VIVVPGKLVNFVVAWKNWLIRYYGRCGKPRTLMSGALQAQTGARALYAQGYLLLSCCSDRAYVELRFCSLTPVLVYRFASDRAYVELRWENVQDSPG